MISHTELTLWSLSKIREGRNGLASAFPSLKLEKGKEGMSSDGGRV
jgi:hypothetical protein